MKHQQTIEELKFCIKVMGHIIEAQEKTISYKKAEIKTMLDDLNFEVQNDDFSAVLGKIRDIQRKTEQLEKKQAGLESMKEALDMMKNITIKE